MNKSTALIWLIVSLIVTYFCVLAYLHSKKRDENNIYPDFERSKIIGAIGIAILNVIASFLMLIGELPSRDNHKPPIAKQY